MRRDGYTFVPLLAQADRLCFTHCQPAFLLFKPAPLRGNLSQQKCRKRNTLFRCALHSRLPSAPQRYNTLDFPDGKSCAKGSAAPLDTPPRERCSPLDTPCQQGCYPPLLETQSHTNRSWRANAQPSQATLSALQRDSHPSGHPGTFGSCVKSQTLYSA